MILAQVSSDLSELVLMRLFIIFSIIFISKFSVANQLLVLTENLPPYQYKDKDEHIVGYSVDLVHAILVNANVTTQIKMVPWERGYRIALTQKNVMLFSMVRTKKREELFKWIGEVDQLNYYLFALKARKNLNINSIHQAKKYRIGVSKASFEHDILKGLGFSNLSTNTSYIQLLAMLNANRFDLLFAPRGPLNAMLSSSDYTLDDFTEAYKFTGMNQKLFIAVSRTTDDELVIKLKKAYQNVVQSGEKARLMKLWLNKVDIDD